MFGFRPTAPRSTLARRCQDDTFTRLRLKYETYYHTFEGGSGTHVYHDGQELVMLASNDYLGLPHHPKVIEAGEKALREWGSSTTGSRMANGSRTLHRAFEEELAAFLGTEDCHVLSAGYLACMTAVATFATKGDLLLVDRNVHSSLWTGIRLSGATAERFSHNNPGDLAEILSLEENSRPKMLILEGVYSMEGHLARLPEILEAAAGHNVFTVLDEAHSIGIFGPEGRGSAHHLGCAGEVDVFCGSLSKSLASTGGFVAGPKDVIEYLRTHSKQVIFSAAISPVQVACARAALRLLQDEPEHREALWQNTRRYRELLTRLGFDTWGSESPALPVVIGEREKAYRAWKELLETGLFTTLALSPAVPPGKDLLRTAISAKHTEEDFERIEAAFTRLKKRLF